MRHPFKVLRPEYERLLKSVQVQRTTEAANAARALLVHKDRYVRVGEKMGVPPLLLMALHERESNHNFRTYLGNGQRLDRVTTWVPKGRGPWRSWEEGAEDAIRYDHLNDISVDEWTMPYALWKGEAWNGFGPRGHGIYTGYLWAGTNHYKRGKYVADGVWDGSHVDRQLGMVPLMMAIARLDPSLAIPMMPKVEPPAEIDPMPDKIPEGVGGSVERTRWIQNALNMLGQSPALLVDGSYGRRTRAAVRAYQERKGLAADGLVGPITAGALERDLRALEKAEEMTS